MLVQAIRRPHAGGRPTHSDRFVSYGVVDGIVLMPWAILSLPRKMRTAEKAMKERALVQPLPFRAPVVAPTFVRLAQHLQFGRPLKVRVPTCVHLHIIARQ